ncbi:unnamed protein product [Symbiodinium microadriaticum]|nr:unnamed protein product [Symbiodinium microadriaticum]CAE7947430.1 unnamed protein product [Symbiodinium sp. KB8]
MVVYHVGFGHLHGRNGSGPMGSLEATGVSAQHSGCFLWHSGICHPLTSLGSVDLQISASGEGCQGLQQNFVDAWVVVADSILTYADVA